MSNAVFDMDEAQNQDQNITVSDSKQTAGPQSMGIVDQHNEPQKQDLKRWITIALFVVFIILGQSAAVLLGRLYYTKGGKSKWMSTLVQVAGFPVLLPLYKLFREENTQNNTPSARQISLYKPASTYIFFGLSYAALCMMYSTGLEYLPVSTFSLICASQLASNAIFSLFINSQRFTPYIINSVVLLTISSILLCFNSNSSLQTGISKNKYAIGLVCTIASSVGYGLFLSLTQLAFERILKKTSFKATVDMIFYPSFVATCATLIGLFASGEWNTLKAEMHQFELGKISYFMTLVWIALSWQVYSIGLIGLIVKVSSLFSNVVATFVLPIVPVLAVVFFHETMDGVKVAALLLAIWGFVSYAYQQYLDYYEPEIENQPSTYASGAPYEENAP